MTASASGKSCWRRRRVRKPTWRQQGIWCEHPAWPPHFGEAEWAAEQMGGVTYLFFLRQLARQIDEDWTAVQGRLEAIRRRLLSRKAMLLNVTLDSDNWAQVQSRVAAMTATLPTSDSSPRPWTRQPLPRHEGLTFPAQVNYVGKGANLYDMDYTLHGSVHVISNLLRTTYLWERVRVQGGAYGGFCLFDQRSGVFNYVSYRDPNVAGTLSNYDGVPDFLRQLDLSQEELAKVIIGVIGQLDTYLLPDAKGYVSMQRYLIGETDVLRQQLREEVLATRPAHVRAFADVLGRVANEGDVVVLGSEEAIVGATLDGEMTLTKVL